MPLHECRNSNSNSSTPQEFNLHLEQRNGGFGLLEQRGGGSGLLPVRPSPSPTQRPRPAAGPATSMPLASPAAGEQAPPYRRLLPTPQTSSGGANGLLQSYGGWTGVPSPSVSGDLNAGGGGGSPDGSPKEFVGAADRRYVCVSEFLLVLQYM